MKARLLPLLFILVWLPLCATGQATDSLAAKKWFVPDGAVLQYGGNTGMLAIGPGYSFVADKLNAELLYGFVPKYDAQEPLHLLTLKGIYKPFRNVRLHEQYSITPLRMGLGLSYYFGGRFSLTWGDAYPKGYYWWSSSLRVLGFAGASVNRAFGNSAPVKELSLYSELGTYDLIVTSWAKDEHLKLWDILNVSVGVRASF